MPEYLAPGVYVEERSFRSKSIEGVSTSTTGFAGPTRKGPLEGPLPLLTSAADFERIYGGLTDLQLATNGRQTNFMAHAVRNYFDNGGARLYVTRVYSGAKAVAQSANRGTDNDTHKVIFRARSAGAGLNGRIVFSLQARGASKRALDGAPDGSLARKGTGVTPAKSARIDGNKPTFNVPNGGKLLLRVNNLDQEITFRGAAAEVQGAALVLDGGGNVTITPATTTLTITVDGFAAAQTVTFAAGAIAPGELLSRINQNLRGGYARIDANRLILGSDTKGTKSSVAVTANATLGFAAPANRANVADASNNVGDIARVTADEISALLIAAPADARAGVAADTGKLVLTTVATGVAATLQARAGQDSVHAALGLNPAAAAATGSDGQAASFHVKSNGAWAPALDGDAEILTMNIVAEDADGEQSGWEDVGFGRAHPNSLDKVLREKPTRQADQLSNPYWADIGSNVTADELYQRLFEAGQPVVTMTGGGDGGEPVANDYAAALKAFEAIEDISIVAAPGSSAYTASAQAINDKLIGHAETRKMYRIAVLDTQEGLTDGGAREARAKLDSTKAAIYFPWVYVANPLFTVGSESQPREISLPPSGFVCGIFARNDIEKSVSKAPANEVVRGAVRFELDINNAMQESLNPAGVNCMRYFPGRGLRLWGARLASSDPEWKYVNVRRYFNFLEASIDRGTQWAVFENNGERLWANVRETITSFLYNEWFNGNLLGASPEEAFFVRCDRSTMTQNDLDNGRLVCLIGVAALKPAEFVIFRIGQKTVESRG